MVACAKPMMVIFCDQENGEIPSDAGGSAGNGWQGVAMGTGVGMGDSECWDGHGDDEEGEARGTSPLLG